MSKVVQAADTHENTHFPRTPVGVSSLAGSWRLCQDKGGGGGGGAEDFGIGSSAFYPLLALI